MAQDEDDGVAGGRGLRGRRALAGAAVALAAGLGGCASGSSRVKVDAQLKTDLGKLAVTPAKALALWSIAVGLAQVAEIADPAIAPIAAPIIALANPIVRSLIEGWASEEAAATLAGHAGDLLVVAAPAVKVVPKPSA